VVREYQCEQILTLKGRIVLCAAKLLEQAQAALSSRIEPAAGLERQFPVQASVAMK
jgi:hypothetical protein